MFQAASRSVQPFCKAHQCVLKTTDRQTDRQTTLKTDFVRSAFENVIENALYKPIYLYILTESDLPRSSNENA